MLATVAAIACAGCGDDRRALDAVAAVDSLQRAFADGKLPAACASMTAAARRQAGLFAHGRPDQCPADLAEALAIVQPTPVRGTRPMPRPSEATVSGERATVATRTAQGGQIDVPLVEEDGQWRVDSFLGSAERDARIAAAATAGNPFPSPDHGRVRVADGPDFECFPLVADRFPEIEGGCAMTARGTGVRLTVDTPFGRYEFGRCTLEYALTTDADGRTWSSRVSFGAPGSGGCADFDTCQDGNGRALPWKGRIATRGDRLVHTMRACLDTCIGYFAGTVTLELARTRRGWRVVGDRAPVGRSGLALDGRLALGPAEIRIEAAR